MKANDLIGRLQATVAALDLPQLCLLLNKLGRYDYDIFTISETTSTYTLQSLRKHYKAVGTGTKCSMSNLLVIFEGGPDGHTKFTSSLAAFVVDRLLYSIKTVGKDVVFSDIKDVVKWKECESNELYAG